MKKPNGRACAIIRAISCDVSETFLRCNRRVISRIVPAEGERMKLWQPRRVAANSQAQRRLADPHYGDFANVARLSQQEIDTIVNWVGQGAKQGDPKDLPELPKEITDFQIGKPDYILAMTQEYTVEPHSPDQYVYVTFPTKFKEDKWVQAAEIIPGNKRIVQHVIAHV